MKKITRIKRKQKEAEKKFAAEIATVKSNTIVKNIMSFKEEVGITTKPVVSESHSSPEFASEHGNDSVVP